MFKTIQEFEDAMGSGRVFRNKGHICKFDAEALYGKLDYSPFVCKGHSTNGKWVRMSQLWIFRDGMKEVFPGKSNVTSGG